MCTTAHETTTVAMANDTNNPLPTPLLLAPATTMKPTPTKLATLAPISSRSATGRAGSSRAASSAVAAASRDHVTTQVETTTTNAMTSQPTIAANLQPTARPIITAPTAPAPAP